MHIYLYFEQIKTENFILVGTKLQQYLYIRQRAKTNSDQGSVNYNITCIVDNIRVGTYTGMHIYYKHTAKEWSGLPLNITSQPSGHSTIFLLKYPRPRQF